MGGVERSGEEAEGMDVRDGGKVASREENEATGWYVKGGGERR